MPTEDREEVEFERRRQHIEELKEKITRISGSPDNTFVSPDCPDEVAEKFLEQVLAFEDTEQKPLADAVPCQYAVRAQNIDVLVSRWHAGRL